LNLLKIIGVGNVSRLRALLIQEEKARNGQDSKERGCMRVTLSSKPKNAFLAKLWGPLICVAGSLLVFGKDFSSLDLLLAFPFLLACAIWGVSRHP
jgi:hypothetical protein